MKLFTIGPAQMYPEVLEERNNLVPYFRTAEFSRKMLFVSSMLKDLTGAGEDAQTIFLTASGTGAMEATVANCFSARDKLLVINGGTFGKRFCQICDFHHIPYSSVDLRFGEVLTPEHLSAYEEQGFSALLVNLHETSTGQLYDVQMLSDFCKRNHMLFVVDAISTFLCDDYHMAAYGIDATIISSQKGLCCSPGISFVVMSARLNAYRQKNAAKSIYFDFDDCINNIKRGQTPFTPAVGVLLEIYTMLKKIEKEGKQAILDKAQGNALYFRKHMAALPCNIPAYPLSNAITPVIFDMPVAKELFNYLKEKGIYVNPCGGEMAQTMIRVAHIGDLSIEDHQELIESIVKYLKGANI